MGKIEKIIKKGPVEGQTAEVYPVTSTKAVYDENNKRLDNIITGLQESVSGELNTISKKLVPAINEVNTLAKSKGNGTITEVRMNGASKGTSGIVDLGTVLTEHQDISGKQDKTDNTLATTDKTVIGAINEINTKVGNLTGALTWKGKLDTLPAVTDYEAGDVISVGNKEYVLTVTGSTKAWEELGDEGSYLLKSAAEKTYAKKTDIPTIPAIPTVNNPKVSIKMNGTEKGSFTLNQASAGEVDLGTVITAHQDISGKVDKTLNAKAFEAITIQTTNSAADKAANVAAIKAYEDNLEALGFDTTKGYMIPITVLGRNGFLSTRNGNYPYAGYVAADSSVNDFYNIIILGNGEYYESKIQSENSNELSTTSKKLVPAINEVNTLAKSKGNGTITEVRMNGVSKGTSGVVDLGTVITSHQDISGKADKSAAIGSLSLSLDSTNYKITLSGTKVDGTTFTVSDVIDLPLESVVVNGSYNNTTKKVVLTLQSGSTVEFSVADLVSGLQSEITSTNKLSADLIADGTTNKVVTASEKTTWNGKQDALTNADVLTGITSTKVSNWDNAATNSHTHSNKSVLDGISSTDITNWNSKTNNVGTVTGVKMNGTTNNPTNGVVDLGTVITAHQNISGKQDKLISGTNIKTINGESVLGSGDITISSGASSSAYPEVNHGTGDTTFTLTPNIFHVWDEVASLTLNFGSGISGVANEYLFQFTSGPTATSLTLPDDIKWANDNAPTIEANMIYQVSILKGLASVLEFNNPIVFPIIGDTGGNANEEYAKVYEYFVSTYNLTNAFPNPSSGVIISETLICNDTRYGGPVLKVSLDESYLLLWTQNAIDKYIVPRINNLGVYSTYYWD